MAYPPKWKKGKPRIRQTRCEYNGHKFDSKAEMSRYQNLLLLERIGEITTLEVHPRIKLEVNGQKVCEYWADFRYLDGRGDIVVEDVKGRWKNEAAFKRTENWRIFRIKAKLLKALTGIDVQVIYG